MVSSTMSCRCRLCLDRFGAWFGGQGKGDGWMGITGDCNSLNWHGKSSDAIETFVYLYRSDGTCNGVD